MKLICRVFTWLVFCAAVWMFGLIWFVSQIPTESETPEKADMIVALTGGAGRIDTALSLLIEGKSKVMFISGVSKGVTVPDIIRQAQEEIQRKARAHSQNIFLGDRAVNTIGNAEETQRFMENKNFRSMILVTSNYHMPRAISEFSELMPEIKIIPAPVFTGDFKLDGWLQPPDSRKLILSEYHKYIAGKLRHLLVFATHET